MFLLIDLCVYVRYLVDAYNSKLKVIEYGHFTNVN